MKLRTLALAIALACGLTGISEAKAKKTVVHRQTKAVKAGKSSRKFKAGKFKPSKRVVKKRAVKH
ncbi:MAG TPA: hypothetical protein VG456_00855 [Candidatus Sulfopaludibacter sp.]|jgi:hypothetical protein|nr:hypothetical protein [Candidatus Sulfopaludibacter sp.]